MFAVALMLFVLPRYTLFVLTHTISRDISRRGYCDLPFSTWPSKSERFETVNIVGIRHWNCEVPGSLGFWEMGENDMFWWYTFGKSRSSKFMKEEILLGVRAR